MIDRSPAAMKQFVLTKLRSINAPAKVLEAVERSEMNDVLVAPLRYRPPLSLLSTSISKANVCVAGDALHPGAGRVCGAGGHRRPGAVPRRRHRR
jgi:hypothetical protein